jgi:hypothetical protein
MKRNALKVAFIFTLLFLFCQPKSTRDTIVSMKGQLYVMGNEPFTQLAFRTTDGKIFILKPSQKEQFIVYQNKSIQIKCLILNITIENKPVLQILDIKVLEE